MKKHVLTLVVALIAVLFSSIGGAKGEDVSVYLNYRPDLTYEKEKAVYNLWMFTSAEVTKAEIRVNDGKSPEWVLKPKKFTAKKARYVEVWNTELQFDEFLTLTEQLPQGSKMEIRVYANKNKYTFSYDIATPSAMFWVEGIDCTADAWTDVYFTIKSLYGFDLELLKKVTIRIQTSEGYVEKTAEIFKYPQIDDYNYAYICVIHLTPEEAEKIGEGYAKTWIYFNEEVSEITDYYWPCHWYQ